MPDDDGVEDLKEELRPERKKPKSPLTSKDFLSSGSTLINLAVSDKVNGGFPKGRYIFLVGDSESGKTWLSLTCIAEAGIQARFDKYRFVYDNAEDGALMDLEAYFGKAVAERMEPPMGTKADPEFSDTVQQFYDNLDKALARGPCIYVLDSMDALTSEEEEESIDVKRKARAKGKDAGDVGGSYGTEKAKENSRRLRIARRRLKETGSILIIISQTRDNIGKVAFGPTKTRSGGHALKFFAHVEIWTSVVGQITKDVLKKPRQIGAVTQVHVKKNRITGKKSKVQVPFYHSVGIDDTGGNIQYLIEEGHWEGGKEYGKGKVEAPEFEFVGAKEDLIRKIEDEDREDELRSLVGQVWRTIADGSTVHRRPRY